MGHYDDSYDFDRQKALEKARQEQAKLRESGDMPRPRSWVQKWQDGEQLTRAQAVAAFCQHCMGGPDNAGYKRLVAECTAVKTCPLWPHRPHRLTDSNEDNTE